MAADLSAPQGAVIRGPTWTWERTVTIDVMDTVCFHSTYRMLMDVIPYYTILYHIYHIIPYYTIYIYIFICCHLILNGDVFCFSGNASSYGKRPIYRSFTYKNRDFPWQTVELPDGNIAKWIDVSSASGVSDHWIEDVWCKCFKYRCPFPIGWLINRGVWRNPFN